MQELITEIAIYLGLAALLGLLLGWLIWGMGLRRRLAAARVEGTADARAPTAGDAALRARIQALTRERDRLEKQVRELSEQVAAISPTTEGPGPAEPGSESGDPDSEPAPRAVDEPEADDAGHTDMASERDNDAIDEVPGAAPSFLLDQPPEAPDDLMRIRGIGPATAAALNDRGIWLFSQLAGMSGADIAWLHQELGGDSGRSLETWADQAQILLDERKS